MIAGGYVLSHSAFWELASGKDTPTRAWINRQELQNVTVSVVTVGWILGEISSSAPMQKRKNAEDCVRRCAERFASIGCLHPIDIVIADRWSRLVFVEADEPNKWAWATSLALDMTYVEHADFDYGPMMAIGLRIFDPVEGQFVGHGLGL